MKKKYILLTLLSLVSATAFAQGRDFNKEQKNDNQRDIRETEEFQKNKKKNAKKHPHGMPPGQRMKQERQETEHSYEQNKNIQTPTVGQAVGGVLDALIKK
jgi:uncharacterized protein YdeI (BOF family)